MQRDVYTNIGESHVSVIGIAVSVVWYEEPGS